MALADHLAVEHVKLLYWDAEKLDFFIKPTHNHPRMRLSHTFLGGDKASVRRLPFGSGQGHTSSEEEIPGEDEDDRNERVVSVALKVAITV